MYFRPVCRNGGAAGTITELRSGVDSAEISGLQRVLFSSAVGTANPSNFGFAIPHTGMRKPLLGRDYDSQNSTKTLVLQGFSSFSIACFHTGNPVFTALLSGYIVRYVGRATNGTVDSLLPRMRRRFHSLRYIRQEPTLRRGPVCVASAKTRISKRRDHGNMSKLR